MRESARRRLTRVRSLTSGERTAIVVGSAHRVGSTWLHRLLSEVLDARRATPPTELRETGILRLDTEGAVNWLTSLRGRTIHKTHAMPVKVPEAVKLVTIARDPFDVVVSLSHYLAELPVPEGGWGAEFAEAPIQERLRRILDEGVWLPELMMAWATAPNAVQVRYESLRLQPVPELTRITAELGFAPSELRVQRAVDDARMPDPRSPSATRGSVARGQVGGWREQFTDETFEHSRTAMDGAWVVLRSALGYDEDDRP